MHSSSVLSWICVHVLLPSNLSSGGCHLPVPPLRSPTPLQGHALPFSDSGSSHRLFSPHVSPRHCCAGDDRLPQALAYLRLSVCMPLLVFARQFSPSHPPFPVGGKKPQCSCCYTIPAAFGISRRRCRYARRSMPLRLSAVQLAASFLPSPSLLVL